MMNGARKWLTNIWLPSRQKNINHSVSFGVFIWGRPWSLLQMRSEVRKKIFHLAWSPDSLPASEAAAPLIECLDELFVALEPNLLPPAFQLCVVALWEVLLFEIWNQAEVSSGVNISSFALIH